MNKKTGIRVLPMVNVKCKLDHFILCITLFFSLAIQSYADIINNNNCSNLETINAWNPVSIGANTTLSGALCEAGGGVTCPDGADANDYYIFSPGQNGTLNFTYNSTNNTSVYIDTASCSNLTSSTYRVVNTTQSKSFSLSVSSTDQVYLRINRRVNNAVTNYSLGLNFAPVINHAPILSPSSMTASIAENVPNGSLVVDVNATDSDGDTLTYSITSGNASGTFAINSSTGVISVANSSNLDHTLTPSYTLTVKATDGTLSSTGTVVVNITASSTIVNIGLRDFALRNPLSTRNIKGNLSVIGNTVLCVKNSSGVCYDYTGTSSNSQLNLQYIDINTTDSRTYNNSSQAKLAIPSTATIKWAALYTQGYLNGTNSTTISNIIKEAVYVTIPSLGTLAVTPNILDMYANGTDGYTYDTYASIPSLIGKKGSSINGWITGANIKADTGTEGSGLGNFGAWTLVVVYEDSNETLKNISVYDGYRRVANETNFNTVDIPISGFMTPSHGVVNSKLSLFVGEGDLSIPNDKLYASNLANNFVTINATNAFSSITSGFEANPNFSNNQGIDIQNHQIGVDGNTSHPQIIGNGQQSSTIRLTTTQDAFFPSMVAFSTELYIPDVCYEENITKDGDPLTQIFAGDILDFEVLISNKSAEPAQKVSIKRVFNDDLEYERNSTYVQNGTSFILKTDASGDDVASYVDATKSLILNLGTGATATSGGTILQDQNETFRYQFEPQSDGNITNAYLVTYRDESNISGTGTIVYSDIPIGKCSNRSITYTVIPILPSGKVRIVEKAKNWNDNGGRLFTKIVNKATQYDILFATNDTGSTLTSGEIKKLEILNIENLSSPVVVATPINSLTTINQRYTINFTHLAAYKRLQFRITLKDDTVALSNDFTVRPADFTGTLSGFYAGEALTLTPGSIVARDNANNPSNLYTKVLGLSNIASVSIDSTKTCSANTLGALVESVMMNMTNGQSTSVTATFKDIATNLTLKAVDSAWVATSDDVINGDCVTGSGSNIANASGLFGCNIEGNITAAIIPYELNITAANFTASTTKSWLYDANVSDMYVTAHATVQANNKQHVALQNFTASCYAQPVDLSFYYDANNTNSNVNLSYIAQNGVLTSTLKSFSDLNKTMTIPSSSFVTASASADYRFNIDRAYNIPLSPIDIALRDVKVTSTSVAKNENNATVNASKRFYYGRVKTKDLVTDKTSAPHLLHVEVYSPTPLGGFYQNTLNWYINADDDGTTLLSDGNFSENKGFSNNQPSTSVAIASTQASSDGIVKFTINNLLAEQSSTVHVDVPYWLWNSTIGDYNNSIGATCANHPCFNYKYIKDVDTVGIKSGTTQGSTVGSDYNASYQRSGVKTFR